MDRLKTLFLFTILLAIFYGIVSRLAGFLVEENIWQIKKVLRFFTGVFFLIGVIRIYQNREVKDKSTEARKGNL
ncbi:MAG: hypothetical protein AAF694_23930 [Bacteroidota bacterium]